MGLALDILVVILSFYDEIAYINDYPVWIYGLQRTAHSGDWKRLSRVWSKLLLKFSQKCSKLNDQFTCSGKVTS